MPPPLLVPDEIVDQVLHLALTISEETFRKWRTPQTYAGTPLLHLHRILATSSQWYRVGKPYLYEAAILRTTEQVRGFCDAICKDHGGEKLARYLRRLRVDSGYTPELGRILSTAGSQITELFLGFDVSIDDRLDNLLESLEQVNPSRLFLDGCPFVKYDIPPPTRVHALCDAIAHACPGWSRLGRVDVGPVFPIPHELLESLFALPQVEYVSCNIDFDSDDLTFEWLDDVLRPILERPTLKVLQIRNGKDWLSCDLPNWGAEFIGVREKLFLGDGKDIVSLAAFPEHDVIIPEPTSLPKLPDKIWARILWIATHYDEYDPSADYETIVWAYRADRTPLDTGLEILRVCKQFYRIGLEHLYAHPFLHPRNTERFLRHIQKDVHLAALVRVLHVDPNPHADEPGAMFKQFFGPLINLVRVNCGIQVFPSLLLYVQEDGVVPLEVLEQRIAPPDMRKQRLAPTDMITPSMFLKLPHLRRVVLTGGRAGRLGEAPQVDLPQLECLHLYEPGLGLTKLFRDMNLPCLREFGLKATSQAAVTVHDFLKVHGAKLSVLTIQAHGTEDYKQPIFDHCPNITELRLETGDRLPARIPFLSKSKPHPRLERITLPGVSLARRPQMVYYGSRDGRIETRDPREPWMPFVGFLSDHKDKLPALAEVRILGDLDWPINRWQYHQRSVWTAPPVALKLHELGLALADKTGARWCRFDVDYTESEGVSDVPLGPGPDR